jgi:hypothetical protein
VDAGANTAFYGPRCGSPEAGLVFEAVPKRVGKLRREEVVVIEANQRAMAVAEALRRELARLSPPPPPPVIITPVHPPVVPVGPPVFVPPGRPPL